MSYSFKPLTDQELDDINVMDEGIYDFEIIKSSRKISKSGNDMAEVQLRVWDMAGKVHIIYDYLVFSSVPLNIKKVKHFCDTVGLHEEYKKGCLPEELDNYSGKAHIGIKDPQPKGDGTFYPKKNVVLDYVMTNKGATKQNTIFTDDKKQDDFKDDDLPF